MKNELLLRGIYSLLDVYYVIVFVVFYNFFTICILCWVGGKFACLILSMKLHSMMLGLGVFAQIFIGLIEKVHTGKLICPVLRRNC